MHQEKEGAFKQTFSLDHCTGRFLKDELERVPMFDGARRFSCVFLSTSAKDAVRLNHHLSAAGIRAYHASDTREAEVLLAITSAKILLIDIDRTFEAWLEILQRLDESHPNLPKIVLTARDESTWPLILSYCALDVVSKPAHLGDLLGALESAHSVEREINDPERARERERGGYWRRSAPPRNRGPRSIWARRLEEPSSPPPGLSGARSGRACLS